MKLVMLSVVLLSGSESFVITFPEATAFFEMVFKSSVATGASFTSVTVMMKVPVSVAPLPSETVYVTVGTVPT